MLASDSVLTCSCVDTKRYEDLDANGFLRYRNKKPIILRNAVPANLISQCVPSDCFTLQQTQSNASIEVLKALDNENFIDNPLYTNKEVMHLKTFLTEFTGRSGQGSGPRLYCRTHVSTLLLNKLKLFDMFERLLPQAPVKPDLMRTWISHQGSTTPLHYDRCHGFLVQLRGRKRFVLVSHEESDSVYQCDGVHGPTHASRVRGIGKCFSDLQELDSEYVDQLLSRYKKMQRAEIFIADLGPGDVVYTPPGWWHEVTSVDDSISLTIPWDMNAAEMQHIPANMAF
ncbi:hypothetical protein BZG36_04411 [Bifiguratus adelaidae]|uniref:JmjC domain-containing protein n=1 Tax=Bifiguratus adelaidae TaxID=1938954 RepID=A0A261XWB8_9FUNG|nr:hypothetical protein BZG36_04411 [Bifiguratus adelaidae]